MEWVRHQNTVLEKLLRRLGVPASFVPSVYDQLKKGVKETCLGMSTNTGLCPTIPPPLCCYAPSLWLSWLGTWQEILPSLAFIFKCQIGEEVPSSILRWTLEPDNRLGFKPHLCHLLAGNLGRRLSISELRCFLCEVGVKWHRPVKHLGSAGSVRRASLSLS